MLGLIKRCSPDRLNIASKWSLYLSLVRPCAGYASVVWSPYLHKDMKLLEQLQQRTTKFNNNNKKKN